jgi:hypothetical protein
MGPICAALPENGTQRRSHGGSGYEVQGEVKGAALRAAPTHFPMGRDKENSTVGSNQ